MKIKQGGKLQKEGNVIHVIVRHCENWSPLLRNLTTDNKLDVRVLTLSPRDEKDGTPFKIQNKKTQKRQLCRKNFSVMAGLLDRLNMAKWTRALKYSLLLITHDCNKIAGKENDE